VRTLLCETHTADHDEGRRRETEMSDLETCSKCGAAVADSYRHNRWHEKSDDELSSLKRVVRDLETSTKRSLQQFEAAVRRLP
jgi:ribosomal protein L37E